MATKEFEELIQKLDKLYLSDIYIRPDEKTQCCKICGERKSYFDFHTKYTRYTSKNYHEFVTDTCNDCYDFLIAKNGLTTGLAKFFNPKSHKPTGYWSKYVTDEIVKTKIILNKLQKKINDYDASKH